MELAESFPILRTGPSWTVHENLRRFDVEPHSSAHDRQAVQFAKKILLLQNPFWPHLISRWILRAGGVPSKCCYGGRAKKKTAVPPLPLQHMLRPNTNVWFTLQVARQRVSPVLHRVTQMGASFYVSESAHTQAQCGWSAAPYFHSVTLASTCRLRCANGIRSWSSFGFASNSERARCFGICLCL